MGEYKFPSAFLLGVFQKFRAVSFPPPGIKGPSEGKAKFLNAPFLYYLKQH